MNGVGAHGSLEIGDGALGGMEQNDDVCGGNVRRSPLSSRCGLIHSLLRCRAWSLGRMRRISRQRAVQCMDCLDLFILR